MKIPYRSAAVVAAALLSFAGLAAPALAKNTGGTSVIYSSIIASPLPGNLPSLGAEAYSFNELGNAITFSGGTNRQLTNVVVTLSTWGCVSGHWYSGDCLTPAGATFTEPITLNIYDASGSTVLASVTQTFAVPYRPSASARCGDGRWFDSSLKTCFNGQAINVTFNLANVSVPDSVVYGIAYNTTNHGYSPIGANPGCPAGGCGYDSLNIALSQEPSQPVVGKDTAPGTVWEYATSASCPGDTVGLFTSTACWNPYIPAVQFKAGGGGHA